MKFTSPRFTLPLGSLRVPLAFVLGALLFAGGAYAVKPPSVKNAGASFAVPSSMAPGIPTNLTVGASASVGTTLTSAGVCVRIYCTAACQYRVTLGSSTAVATDNTLPAGVPERFCLTDQLDTLTFYNTGASSLTAQVAVSAGPTS